MLMQYIICGQKEALLKNLMRIAIHLTLYFAPGYIQSQVDSFLEDVAILRLLVS